MYLGKLSLKNISIVVLCLFVASGMSAQCPVKCLSITDGLNICDTTLLHKTIIPEEIKTAALLALTYYPELQDVKIVFRFRNKITPLSTRPQLLNFLRPKHKHAFVITISRKTIKQIKPILFFNLPFNAQVGVLGHELAHILEFSQKSKSQLIALFFKNLKSSNTDRFEFNTDRVCIDHGLGYQLYDWSAYVREALQIKEWKGAAFDGDTSMVNQRYMNPQTIHFFMQKNEMYYSSYD